MEKLSYNVVHEIVDEIVTARTAALEEEVSHLRLRCLGLTHAYEALHVDVERLSDQLRHTQETKEAHSLELEDRLVDRLETLLERAKREKHFLS